MGYDYFSYFSFHFFEAPHDHLRVFFSDPPSRDVDLSKENIIAPPPPPPAHKYNMEITVGRSF